jgi:pyruvate-ferredoxin/flavodoxin oxidoreductase
MRERPSGAIGWLQGLFGGGAAEPPQWSGEATLTTGRRALVAAEAMACDALCRVADESGPTDRSVVNAFGEQVGVTESAGAHGVVATASGLALAGRRVAGFVPDDQIPDLQDLLAAAAGRRLPLVLHAAVESVRGNGRGHGNYHAAANTGLLLAFARNVVEALDLTLVARRVAEQSLTPALIATDATETAWAVQDLQLPDPGLVRAFVADPGATIDCPTPAQRLVFGERRRRVPRWFDMDRPAALGVPLSGPDFDAAVAGRQAFFAAHLAPLLDAAMRELAEQTGRRLDWVTRHRMDGARHVIVAQGAAVETAEAVADHLRRVKKGKVGVLGITWLRPFPAEEIGQALASCDVVTVLERGTEPSAETPPLLREIRATLAGGGPRLISATFAELNPSEVVAACHNMQAPDGPTKLRLGIGVPEQSGYPRRQAFLQRVGRDYPGLRQISLQPGDPVDLRPDGCRTVALHVQSEPGPEELLEALGRMLSEAVGSHVRGSTMLVEPGLWHARVTAGREELREPGDEVLADITLIEDVEPSLEMNPMLEAAPRGSVVLATRLEPADLWAAMRAPWRDAVRERDLRLFLVRGGGDELIAAAAQLLEEGSGDLIKLLWRELDDAPRVEVERELPAVVRRFEGTGSTYDNVSRFWGEFAQPRLEGEDERPVPDPYLALGAVPPCTATFHDMTAQREQVPVIDPSACTGCGKCWSSCPDSAIGALAIGSEALLQAAAEKTEAPQAEKLRRAYKQLAAKLDGTLVKSGEEVLTDERLRETYTWLVGQMKPGAEESSAFDQAFEADLEQISALPLALTDPLFRDAHRETKGSGELLLLAVNPQACQGCGVCAAVCPDEAIRTEAQTPQRVQSMRELWQRWEGLPDTAGTSIARAAEHPRVGPLPAILMSRHCLYSLAGGDGAEPGSGERLVTRQVAAVVEYQMQRRLLGQSNDLAQLQGRLSEAIQAAITAAVPLESLEHLHQALETTAREGADVGAMLERLKDLGQRTDFDVSHVHRLTQVAKQIERARWRLTEGALGMGRARYGLVVTGRSAAAWAARFPRNPFVVPLTADLAGNGADLAIGLLEGLLAERVAEARLRRHAELLIDAPADLPARERQLEALTWRDLTPEEMALCPPILVLGGPDGLVGEELAGLSRLLSCGMPVKVVLLDDCALSAHGPDPALLALSHRDAFVLSTSVAHTEHLFHGLTAGLRFTGPALIRVHAPSPGRHGFAEDATVERALQAVAARVSPLLRYDPAQEGVFGLRLDLEGNPAADQSWVADESGAAVTPAHWAAAEERFSAAFSDAGEEGSVSIDEYLKSSSDARGSTIPTVPGPNGRSLAVGESVLAACRHRAAIWSTLQELSGLVNPFTGSVREQVAEELSRTHGSELETLRAEYEGKLEEQRRSQSAEQAVRLRERLLQLAGYGKES